MTQHKSRLKVAETCALSSGKRWRVMKKFDTEKANYEENGVGVSR